MSPADTLSSLQSVNVLNLPAGELRYMKGRTGLGDGAQGVFIWRAGDLTTEVSTDEVDEARGNGGIWIAPASDLTGSGGAWERLFSGDANAAWWGAHGEPNDAEDDEADGDAFDNSPALSACFRTTSIRSPRLFPPGAEGFTVDTPSAQVIDLGTSFGIDLTNDGFSNVSVFDGDVEVAPLDSRETDTTERLLLSEGESVRIGTGYEIEDIDFDPKPFEKMWPFASGIVGSTDTISFVPPWPRKIRLVKSDELIFVRPEGHAVQLETELKVNISEPSDCAEIGDLSPKILQVEETVRSYVLHFSPETQLVERRAKRATGSITFDRPVLGIIVRQDELLASSRRFGRRGVGESHHRRELNLTGDDAGDRITLSEDRKTVTLDLISPRKSSDLVRVIVDSSGGFQPPARRKRN